MSIHMLKKYNSLKLVLNMGSFKTIIHFVGYSCFVAKNENSIKKKKNPKFIFCSK